MTSLDDHHAIVQLTHDYCWALDTGDWDALHDVFTPDAMTDLGAGGQIGIGEIIERVSSALDRFEVTQHLVATHQVRLDGDEATYRYYLQAQHVRATAAGWKNMLIGARYEDRCVRTERGWRIAERKIVFMWSDPPRAAGFD